MINKWKPAKQRNTAWITFQESICIFLLFSSVEIGAFQPDISSFVFRFDCSKMALLWLACEPHLDDNPQKRSNIQREADGAYWNDNDVTVRSDVSDDEPDDGKSQTGQFDMPIHLLTVAERMSRSQIDRMMVSKIISLSCSWPQRRLWYNCCFLNCCS